MADVNNGDELITMVCERCHKSYQIKRNTANYRKWHHKPSRCKECTKIVANEARSKCFSSLSPEEKKKYIEKRNWYKNATPEQKEAHAQRTRDQLAKRTKEEWDEVNKKNSEGLKRHWATLTQEQRDNRVKNMQDTLREMFASMTPEERSALQREKYLKIPEEHRKELEEFYRNRMIAYNESVPMEEKIRRAECMQKWHAELTPEQKKELYTRTHQWYYDLNDEEKEKYAQQRQDWYANLPDEMKEQLSKDRKDWYENLSAEEKEKYAQERGQWYYNLTDEERKIQIRKTLLNDSTRTGLNIRFEDMFYSSYLENYYYIKPEDVCITNNVSHSWDYGIYDKSDDKLVMVVDLDGSFYHADSCDYDGIHSNEWYDERRTLSVPEDVKICFIYEKKFTKSFEMMVKILMQRYDTYMMYMFRMCRAMPFPAPQYSDKELIKSYQKLERMKCDDIYHSDISLNTRVGDILINHFHQSIWRAHRKGSISPYDAWHDDELLKKCIENRVICQTYLNPNKILQGFNIAKIAQKVSVFSAARAKMIINHYLLEYDTVFDPFSSFSGRMLGTVSLGKKYIGQDISLIHVNESNQMIQFLHEKGFSINAEITQQNILESSGEYPCLFTCSPYSDKEQWLDVPVDIRTCDDWIDECLKRFKCSRYVFVVDETEKYKNYIIDYIRNKFQPSNSNEYIIVINGEG